MSEQVREYWKRIILKLQKAEDEIVKTQGYTREAEGLRALKELIKEQYPDENFSIAAGEVR